jgi:D-alanyl-lipoteichoic acid acyltransferase DltB (MBOAT superfamily)
MLFNSNVFLFAFLPLALLGFYLLAHWSGDLAAKVWLCAASFVFYGWWNPAFLLLLAGSIAFNYALSTFLDDSDDDRVGRQTLLLGAGIGANLLLLFYYKYLFPLLGYFHSLGIVPGDYGSVVLPIGISFFTFTQIGYLVDCRQGLVRERGLLNYLLFVTFFPHLIAGPILHNREIMPQFANRATYRYQPSAMAEGLTVFAAGMFKKVILADSIAPWAELGFAHLHGMGLVQSWSVALAYSMQLYFDFSGYSDMAIGLGIMFGIRLPLNFNSPYKASSIIEFWQRWHMTLTRYLTLLLYNPLSMAVARRRQRAGLPSGARAGSTPSGFAAMIVYPTMTTMFLAGIWHGAGFQFICYGLLHGLYLCVNHAWRIWYPTRSVALPLRGAFASIWRGVWPVALTFVAVLVAQVFFRANSSAEALTLIAGMIGMHGSGFPLPLPGIDLPHFGALRGIFDGHVFVVGLREDYNSITRPLMTNLLLTLGLAMIAFGAPNIYQIMAQYSPALNKVKEMSWRWLVWRPSLGWAIVVVAFLVCAAQRFDHPARFLYFQF